MSATSRVFGHALRLPLAFFEKRPVGHLIERYRMTNEVEQFLISSLPLALIDGVMTLLSIALVVYFAPALAALSFGTVLLYLVLKAAGQRGAHARQAAVVWAKGEENGHLIETLRTIFTTKVNALEHSRYSGWLRPEFPRTTWTSCCDSGRPPDHRTLSTRSRAKDTRSRAPR